MKAIIHMFTLVCLAVNAMAAPVNVGEVEAGLDAASSLTRGLEGMSLDASREALYTHPHVSTPVPGLPRVPVDAKTRLQRGGSLVVPTRAGIVRGDSSLARANSGIDTAELREGLSRARLATMSKPGVGSSVRQRLHAVSQQLIQKKPSLQRSKTMTRKEWTTLLDSLDQDAAADKSRFNDDLRNSATSSQTSKRLAF